MAEPTTDVFVSGEPELPTSEVTLVGAPEGEYGASAEPEVTPQPEDRDLMLWMYLWSYSIIIILILTLNGLIVAAVLKGKMHKINAINIYLLSLVISRMSIGVLVVPARITGLFSEAYLGSFLCKLCHYFAMGSGASSVFSTTAIAIVKFQEIVLKKGVITVTCKRALRDVIIIWFCGHVYALRAPFFNDITVVRGFVSCAVTPEFRQLNNYFIFVDIFVLFILPMNVVIYCYIRLVRYLNQLAEKQPLPSTPRITPPPTKSLKVDLEITGNAKNNKLAWGVTNAKPDLSTHALNVHQSNNHKNSHTHKMMSLNTLIPDVTKKQGTKEHGDNQVRADTPKDKTTVTNTAKTEDADAEKKWQNRSVLMVIIVTGLFVTCTVLPYIPKLYAYWATNMFANFPIFETICYQISYSNAWINAVVIFVFRPDITRMIRVMCRCANQVDSEVTPMDNRNMLLRTD